MKTFLITALLTLIPGCAGALSSANCHKLNTTGEALPSIRHMVDMKVYGDTLLFVYEIDDGYGQRFLRRAVIDRNQNRLKVSPDMGKRGDGYYVSYMPYPFIADKGSIHVVNQDDGEIYSVENDTVLVRTKQYLVTGNSTVSFPISQYVQDVFMTGQDNYVFVGREPKGGRQFAMTADIASSKIDTILPINVSPELLSWMPNAGEQAYSGKHNRLVFAYRYHPVTEIFGADGSVVKTVEVSEPTFDPATLEMADFEAMNPVHFIDITSTDEHIYALYWGHKYGEPGNSKIYRIDWNGNITAQCTLSCDIFKIAALDVNLIIGWNGKEFVVINFNDK